MIATETYLNYFYTATDISCEGFSDLKDAVWKTIKGFFRKIIEWFKRLLLNINYFKNTSLDDQLNRDLIQVLKICQPRTESNFAIINSFYKVLTLIKSEDLSFNGILFGVSSQNPTYGLTDITTEIDKSLLDITESMSAARNSIEYKRIEENKYENKNIKQIPLSYITTDMKKSQKSCTKYEIELDKIESKVNKLSEEEKKSSNSLIAKMGKLLKKIVEYYTFRINLLTKYLTSAKASLSAAINNIKDRDHKTKTNTKRSLTVETKKILLPKDKERAKEILEEIPKLKTIDQYTKLRNELFHILKENPSNIIAQVKITDIGADYLRIKEKKEKIPIGSKTLYHTSVSPDVKELSPKYVSNGGELFPSPRVYFHIGVPLNRYGNKNSGSGMSIRNGSNGFVYTPTINIATVYRDPEMGYTSVYVETDKPIPVKPYRDRTNDINNQSLDHEKDGNAIRVMRMFGF